MKKKLWFKILVNFIAWWTVLLFIVSAEQLIDSYGEKGIIEYHIRWSAFGAISLLLAIFTVSHYYLLYVKFFQTKKYLAYVLGCIILLVLLVVGQTIILNATFFHHKNIIDGIVKLTPVIFLQSAFLYTPAAIFYALIKGNVALLKRKKELEQQQLQSSIAVLKSQLDPHFLFNSLNVIYATARNEKANKTSESIEELTGLFRYSLEEAGQEKVSIEKELQFIDKYLHLQKLRIPEGEQIKIINNIHWDKQPVQIAPMLLLPFIENAYKYGISYQHPSEVNIDISIENGLAKVRIANTNHADKVQTSSTGIGKENALKRLALQYNDKFEFSELAEEGMYRVSLTIEL